MAFLTEKRTHMTGAACHEWFMRKALAEAGKAARLGEVPAGCVMVFNGTIIARAHNRTETSKNPAAHAEMLAIQRAAKRLGDWRLNGAVCYVTKEPCAMCAGALVLARVSRVVCGFSDPKRGGVSLFNITGNKNLNHQPEVVFDVLRDECLAQFQAFFQARRKNGPSNDANGRE